jgi:nucleotide-binding universal stress UspA family protein
MQPVLVATIGRTDPHGLVREGVDIARRTGAEIVFLSVVPLSDRRVPSRPLSLLGPTELSPDSGDVALQEGANRAREAGLGFRTEVVASARPHEAIAARARRHGADVVLVELDPRRRFGRLRRRRLARRLDKRVAGAVVAVR